MTRTKTTTGSADDDRFVDPATLILDYTLYPRHSIDAANVAALTKALDAGETLPAVIVDKASNRIVDGFHRWTAHTRHFDPGVPIAVEWRSYDSDADLFLDAVNLNAAHGVRLTQYDQARCVQIAHELHVDDDSLAGALHITVGSMAKMTARKTAFSPEGKPLPIHRTVRHLAGKKLTKKQAAAEKRTGGMSIRFYAEQVRNALAGDLVDWDDAATVDALRALDVALHPAVGALGV